MHERAVFDPAHGEQHGRVHAGVLACGFLHGRALRPVERAHLDEIVRLVTEQKVAGAPLLDPAPLHGAPKRILARGNITRAEPLLCYQGRDEHG